MKDFSAILHATLFGPLRAISLTFVLSTDMVMQKNPYIINDFFLILEVV
jgi:hypothetical protein